MTRTALIADVGGTHTRLALAGGGEYGEAAHYLNADAATLEDLVAEYVAARGVDTDTLEACLAVAAPVTGDAVVLTNLDWTVAATAFTRRFAFRRVRLVNDFAAIAHALPALADADVAAIGDTATGGDPGAPGLVLGPGTGLGAALRVPHAHGATVVATEAGHATLAASDDEQARLLAALRESHGRVSAERVLSGNGLVSLYAVLGGNPRGVVPATVTERALAGGDAVADAALAHFFAFLGGFAGDLALATGARGGVHLAGGILPRLVEPLRASAFRAAFEAKGRFAAWLADVPTRVVVHPDPALLGLAALTAGARAP